MAGPQISTRGSYRIVRIHQTHLKLGRIIEIDDVQNRDKFDVKVSKVNVSTALALPPERCILQKNCWVLTFKNVMVHVSSGHVNNFICILFFITDAVRRLSAMSIDIFVRSF